MNLNFFRAVFIIGVTLLTMTSSGMACNGDEGGSDTSDSSETGDTSSDTSDTSSDTSGTDTTAESDGGNEQAMASCAQDCAELLAAGCSGSPTQQECESNCMESYGRCPDEVLAVTACVTTYSCDPDDSPRPIGCDSEHEAFHECYNE